MAQADWKKVKNGPWYCWENGSLFIYTETDASTLRDFSEIIMAQFPGVMPDQLSFKLVTNQQGAQFIKVTKK